ncbi:MAG: hypothetical protein R8K46_09145, partial [Mariprofundaceae bacterium]
MQPRLLDVKRGYQPENSKLFLHALNNLVKSMLREGVMRHDIRSMNRIFLLVLLSVLPQVWLTACADHEAVQPGMEVPDSERQASPSGDFTFEDGVYRLPGDTKNKHAKASEHPEAAGISKISANLLRAEDIARTKGVS